MRLYTVQSTVKFIWLADFVFLLYIAQSRQSARLFLQVSEWAPQLQEMVSPSFGSGGRHTRLRVRGSLYGVDVTA
jgi:hypothetical protein